ncbi:hypothetical protein Lal_00013731 [Lupinus albus]|nr:hypothetical protein Lal_00013731 [Lupinus albus]
MDQKKRRRQSLWACLCLLSFESRLGNPNDDRLIRSFREKVVISASCGWLGIVFAEYLVGASSSKIGNRCERREVKSWRNRIRVASREDSIWNNSPTYDELYNAFVELHEELKQVAKVNIIVRELFYCMRRILLACKKK